MTIAERKVELKENILVAETRLLKNLEEIDVKEYLISDVATLTSPITQALSNLWQSPSPTENKALINNTVKRNSDVSSILKIIGQLIYD